MPVPNSTDIGAKFCPSCGRQFAMGYDEDRCPDDGNLLIVPATDPLIGKTVLERFTIQAVIGAGGWGLVYKARHVGLNKDVALKVLHPHLVEGRDNVMRFRREAEAASRLTHKNIVYVSDYGLLEDGRPYMAMEYLQGLSLSDMIERRGALKWQNVVHIFIETCEGVAYAHRKGFLHRDLKPSNVFVSEFEGNQHVKLLDFGLAKLVSDNNLNAESLTQTGTAIGTPAYMSPEQCRGLPLDRRSDIYSFGYLMYEVLTGTKAFGGSGLYEVMHAHTTAVPPSFTSLNRGLDVPPALEAVVMRALAKDPEDRFASAEEMIEELQKVANIETKPAARLRRSTSYQRLPDETETVKRSTVISLVLLVMLVGGIAFSVYAAYLNPRHDKPPVTAATTGGAPGTTAITAASNPSATASNPSAAAVPGTAAATGAVAQPTATGSKPGSKPEVKMTEEEAEHLKIQVKLLEERLKIQQKQITEATSATPRVVIQQVAVPAPVQTQPAPPQTAAPTRTAAAPKLEVQQYAGSGKVSSPTATGGATAGNRNVPDAYKALPPDLAAQLRTEDPPIQTVRRCEDWLQDNGYNYAVENLLRQILVPIDKNRAMFYVNDMLKHNVMDDYQLQMLGGWRMNSDPAAAIGELYLNAETYKHYKYLRVACFLRGGQIFKAQAKNEEAKRCFFIVASATDPELQRYRELAADMLKKL